MAIIIFSTAQKVSHQSSETIFVAQPPENRTPTFSIRLPVPPLLAPPGYCVNSLRRLCPRRLSLRNVDRAPSARPKLIGSSLPSEYSALGVRQLRHAVGFVFSLCPMASGSAQNPNLGFVFSKTLTPKNFGFVAPNGFLGKSVPQKTRFLRLSNALGFVFSLPPNGITAQSWLRFSKSPLISEVGFEAQTVATPNLVS